MSEKAEKTRRVLTPIIIILVLVITSILFQSLYAPRREENRYFRFSEPRVVLIGDQSWELNGSGWIGTHTLQVVEANFNGYRFWGYYCHPWIGIGLAWSNDLINWTKYEENPIIPDGRWPSVFYLNGFFYMFYTFDYDKDSGIRLAVSRDGIHFEDKKTIVWPEPGKRNQNPFIFMNPIDRKFYLYYYHGEARAPFPWVWEIRVKIANKLSGLDMGEDLIVLWSWSKTLAAPSIIYWNGKYYLTCETYEGDVWKTVAFSSDSPVSDFVECINSPILTDDEACAMQYVIDNKLYIFWSKLSNDKRTWDTRVAFSPLIDYD